MIEIAHFTTLGHDRAKPELPKTGGASCMLRSEIKGT